MARPQLRPGDRQRPLVARVKGARLAAAVLLGGALLSTPARAAFLSLEPLRGYLDVGLAVHDAQAHALNGGTGKLRYGERGGGLDFEPKLSEARLIGALGLGSAWRVLVDVKYDDEQRHLLDIGEAFLAYRSPPAASGLQLRLKAGTFLPPFSLENRAIGWTSPYTLSSSALNAWIGEELRINGAELRLVFERADWQYNLASASYFANDTAGTVLALRGWAIHDRELGLFDRMRMPRAQLALFKQAGIFASHLAYYEPRHEIDRRPGFYAGGSVRDPQAHKFEFYYYNNAGDPEAINRSGGGLEWAWRTRFWVAGFETPLPGDVLFVTQALLGDTAIGRRRGPRRGMDMDYFSGYGLLTRSFGTVQASVRGEYFEMRDRDGLRGAYDNSESGYGVTVAASRQVAARLRLLLEAQYVEHQRPVRVLSGQPRRADEWLLRVNLRWYL